MNLFNCKISYLKQNDNGTISRKTDIYEVEAFSFTEAEANLQKRLEETIPEYNLLAMKKSNISDIVFNEGLDLFFQAKVNYTSHDEDSGKLKSITEIVLVQEETVKDATKVIIEKMAGSVVEWKIKSVTEINLTEVFLLEK